MGTLLGGTGSLSADSSADETVPAAIAVALGLRPALQGTLAALVEAVTRLEVLIALDNAEHVRPAVARVVEAVLQSAPRARFLVTSQIPLNAKGEQLYRLGRSPGLRSESRQSKRFATVRWRSSSRVHRRRTGVSP